MSTLHPGTAADLERIARLPLFAGLDRSQVERVAALARRVPFAAGTTIMEEGSPGDGLYIIAGGEVEVRKGAGGGDVPLAVRGPGDFLGELSLLGDAPRTATVVAITDGELLVVDPGSFQRLLAECPPVLRTVLRTVAGRVRSTEALLTSREKLASLGTMAAGLAHELNNPAAAIGRAAAQLRDVMAELPAVTAAVGMLALSPAQAERLGGLTDEADRCEPADWDALGRGAAEDAVIGWLEDHAVERAWEIAPALVSFGWARDRLDALADTFDGPQVGGVARWLGVRLAARELLDQIERSARAMSGIITAVRSHVYLDQAPVQDVDIVESLENTLVILRYRLKHGIEIVRDYGRDVPRIEAWGSELSQVWTNLIGNAVDALEGTGTITLRTRRRSDRVTVEIVDDGPGIPDAVRPRLFEPFFTTKPPGIGSGLGLHIVHNIVVGRHGGAIDVDSRPGRTRFCVSLPVRLRRGPA